MSMSGHDYPQVRAKIPPNDRRSADGRLLRRTRESLTDRIAGEPTAIQVALIDQVAWLRSTLYLARLNEKALSNGGFHSPTDAQMFLDYSDSRTAALAQLRFDTIPAPVGWSGAHQEVAA